MCFNNYIVTIIKKLEHAIFIRLATNHDNEHNM